MIYRFTAASKAHLKKLANPRCEECDGEGVLVITPNSDPTGGNDFDSPCPCTKADRGEEEPEGDAWSGGFAENH